MFKPLGAYPRGTICTPEAIFHADGDIVFCITHGSGWGATGDLPYSEVDWLEPETIRLLGALMMTEQFPEGIRCRFYPVNTTLFTVEEDALDLSNPEIVLAMKNAILDVASNSARPQHIQDQLSECLGKEINLFDPAELSIDYVYKYWAAIETSNHVLMRAIQALVKSDMLVTYREFQEEATIATFIALDASHELVLRHLRTRGTIQPSSAQAGEWLYKTFDEPMGVHGSEGLKYFEEFHAQRVQTLHAGSRYGDLPFAPISFDDYIHLRQALPGVLGYLVLGEHPPVFWKQVAERAARWQTPIPDCCPDPSAS